MAEFRKVEIFNKGDWVEAKFEDIKLGDIFRMFEPDTGEEVKDKEGCVNAQAVSEIYTHPELNVLTVNCRSVNLKKESK